MPFAWHFTTRLRDSTTWNAFRPGDLELVSCAQQMQAGNVAGILRRGQKEGGATVVFATNDGERYEAEWSIRLTRNGNYKTPERTLKQLGSQQTEI